MIDDDPAVRDMLDALLRRSGWHVTAVRDRDGAMEAVEAADFDALLVDVELGTDDGPALLRALDRRRPGTAARAAFLTGAAPEDRHLDGRAVLGKPFDWTELEQLLARLRER